MKILGNKITKIEAVETWHFWLRYKNGALLYLNLADIAEEAKKAIGGYLVPFQNPAYFELAQVDEDGALIWPNGFDVCPDYLYFRGNFISDAKIEIF